MGRLKAEIRHALQVGDRVAYYPVDVTDYRGAVPLGVFTDKETAIAAIKDRDDLEGNDTVQILYKFRSGLVFESRLFMGGKAKGNEWSEIGYYNRRFVYYGFMSNKVTEVDNG